MKKNDKSDPLCLGKSALSTPNIREIRSFDPLYSQKVAIMAPFLGHVSSSQQLWDKRGQNCNFLK